MKKILIAITALVAFVVVAVIFVTGDAAAEFEGDGPIIGQAAPDFTATDADGKTVNLADFRGKTVVLEWHNPGCPSVKMHYSTGNMQRTQEIAANGGAVWLSINSGARFKQGHMDGDDAKDYVAENGARPTAYLLDHKGVVGKAYHAKTTPHMFVIDDAGILVYAGAIDDNPSTNRERVASARNHVLAALTEMNEGKAVSVPTSRPYGCAVKY